MFSIIAAGLLNVGLMHPIPATPVYWCDYECQQEHEARRQEWLRREEWRRMRREREIEREREWRHRY